MLNFFHRLFNPHCEHCRQEDIEDNEVFEHDPRVEILERELASVKAERDKLLDVILKREEPEEIELPTNPLPKPVRVRHVPWAVRREMLEKEDRKAARDKAERLAELSETPRTAEDMERIIEESVS